MNKGAGVLVMQEYELKVLEQYDVNVKGTRKTRGAFFCDTDQGLFLLKEAGISEKKVPALYKLGEALKEAGHAEIDQILPNKEGGYISVSEEGGRYMLKHWYFGRECDIRRSRELSQAVKNLARLHLIMAAPAEEYVFQESHLKDMYDSHNRELRKVRKFVRSRTVKGDFELQFLKEYESLYEWADAAVSELEASSYNELYSDSIKSGFLLHGEYN